jgi:methylmalonyl-CoA mutase N-terminal domain/subunit
VQATLAALKQGAASERVNLMPLLLDCARASASEGEIVQELQAVWGDYRDVPVF